MNEFDEYDPAAATRVLAAMEPPKRPDGHVEEVEIMITLPADGALVVSSPGTPRTRIVATRAKLARAAGQRVAELAEEALAAREHLDA